MRSCLLVGLAAILIGACAKRDATAPPQNAEAQEATALSEPFLTAAPAADFLVDKIWTLADDDGRPGAIRIFLSDGVMLQDSCFETLRLSNWRRESDSRILWSEDGVDIAAEVVEIDAERMTLTLDLGYDLKTENYRAAEAPFVCPDLPR